MSFFTNQARVFRKMKDKYPMLQREQFGISVQDDLKGANSLTFI